MAITLAMAIKLAMAIILAMAMSNTLADFFLTLRFKPWLMRQRDAKVVNKPEVKHLKRKFSSESFLNESENFDEPEGYRGFFYKPEENVWNKSESLK